MCNKWCGEVAKCHDVSERTKLWILFEEKAAGMFQLKSGCIWERDSSQAQLFSAPGIKSGQ